MEQATQFDSNDAFAQVRRSITDLMACDVRDNEDDVMYIVNKLAAVLRAVYDNYQIWSNEVLQEFVLSKHDPLKNLDVKSDELNHLVREIQQDIIVQFS